MLRSMLAEMTDEVWAGACNLVESKAATSMELHDRFVSDGGAFTLSYGGLSTFFSGLEGRIGP